ncbi:Zinc finger, C2CH-type domain-containing protein [Strongyloides ratti]|uniref:Zinc finger, C2CH-type domain-containing protein n=1 Tax=Strongyloides ratti TaxID=34506 RepID=A0A090LQU1_STRRB|nr:Zinc finger, C2CH-type domain-containing protein [Strongyloides ratti]CEF70546.1 Zinc finger, C2CH-type domain-containing protein [Strongyloides ratti]
MERCAFCGWNRKNAFGNIRFFGIPKEPGMKRIQWLYVLANRNINPKEKVKVCSVHFRSGRPSSDPSHEDFVPHLYINAPPLPEELDYIENLHRNNVKNIGVTHKINNSEHKDQSISGNSGPSTMRKNNNKGPPSKKLKLESDKEEYDEKDTVDDNNSMNEDSEERVNHQNHNNNGLENGNQEMKNEEINSNQEILQSQRMPLLNGSNAPNARRIKVQHVPKHVVEAANLQPGVSVILRKYLRH